MTRTSESVTEQLSGLSSGRTELLKLLLEQRSRESRGIPRISRNGAAGPTQLPASWSQQRLWFIDQLQGGSNAYRIGITARLRGVLDEDALRGALNSIVRRHETLRTRFVTAEGEPMQQILAEDTIELTVIDLSALDDTQREEAIRQEKLRDMRSSFDLRAGPLIRASILKTGASEHLLLLTLHHIISDAWSKGVLMRELAALYTAYRNGEDDPLPALPVQYADYAQWQRTWLKRNVLDKQLEYWRRHLEGAPPYLELPTDRERPTVPGHHGEHFDVTLGESLSDDLRKFAHERELTPFMLLYAACAVLLSRLSGQDDIVIGTPVANRQRPELEKLIGFFANSLVLRVSVTPQQTVRDLLKRVRETTLGAYENQDVPFEQVVEALQPDRALNRNPLFQVMLVMLNTPDVTLELPGLTVTAEEAEYESSLFDLLLVAKENAGATTLRIYYPTELFDRGTIEAWLDCLPVLLRAMIDRPDGLVADLDLLSQRQRRRVLALFNATTTAYPRQAVVQELFEKQVQLTPDAVAVEFEEQSLTYAQLNTRANRFARHLTNCGVGPDRLAAICLERSPDMIVAVLAVLKAGGAYLPLDPNYPRERLQFMLEDAAPNVLLTQHSLLPILPETPARRLLLDALPVGLDALPAHDTSPTERGLSSDHLAYVIFTSGSTGRPKGTAMPHRALVNLIEWHRGALPAGPGEAVLQFAALGFDVAFQEIFTTLSTGQTLVLIPERMRRDPAALISILERRNVRRLFVPPLMLQSLAEYALGAQTIPHTLRDVITAGEQLRITPQIKALFKVLNGCRLHNHYGPTETHVVTALTLTDDPEQWPAIPPIGHPLGNTRIYVLDEKRRPVPIGVAGELFLAGAGVARGYINRPALTAERFAPDPFVTDEDARAYRVGDIGRWRADGTLDYLGRNDSQVKIRGYRVELGEIEAELAKNTQVKEAAVIAREDLPGDIRLVAYVIPRDTNALSIETLRAGLKRVLPEHMIPATFVALEQMPLTPNGKLNRRGLPAPDPAAFAREEFEAPCGEIETAVAAIWQRLLQVTQVSRHDDFFRLGGHSLLGMQLISRIRDALFVTVPIRILFEHPTLKDFAARVDEVLLEEFAQESQS